MIKVDARGELCPIPVIKAKKALKEIEKDGVIQVVVDNEIAKENLEKMAKEMGYKYEGEKLGEDHYEVKIIKGEGEEEAKEVLITKGNISSTAIVISSDKMGEGNEELGTILMKAFIYTLTETETLPTCILFYNGGAKLTTKTSAVLEDLKKLEEQGVEILTCGTCLNYYGLTEELAVGSVTNMYSIVEKMNSSHKIIKP